MADMYAGRKPRRISLRERLSWLRQWVLEDKALVGLGGPPNNWQSTNWIVDQCSRPEDDPNGERWALEYAARFGNDAFEIWVAEQSIERGEKQDERWVFHCRATTFRKIAFWYLWRWAWGEWFSLRRRLYYWDLHRRCQKYNMVAPPTQR